MGLGEHLPVGDVDDAAGALIGMDPTFDLEQCELEDPDVDDVAGVVADLDPVADLERLTQHGGNPGGEVGYEAVAGRVVSTFTVGVDAALVGAGRGNRRRPCCLRPRAPRCALSW